MPSVTTLETGTDLRQSDVIQEPQPSSSDISIEGRGSRKRVLSGRKGQAKQTDKSNADIKPQKKSFHTDNAAKT